MPDLHHCKGHLPDHQTGYYDVPFPHEDEYGEWEHSCGEAVERCREAEDGTLWVDNEEYYSQIAFCPYCGYKAKMQPVVLQKYEWEYDDKELDLCQSTRTS
jgi:hypothetical protein